MLTKAFVLVAGATSAYAACSLTPGAGAVQLPANSIVSPDNITPGRTPTKGVPFTIMYDGTGLGPTLDFVLLKGPSTNIIAQGYIATGVQNCGTSTCTLSWTPDCSLTDTAGASNGYGIRMDDEATCKYQYTTQFGLIAGSVCGATPSSSSAAPPSSSASAPSGSSKPSGSLPPPPPTGSFTTSCVTYPTGGPGSGSSGGYPSGGSSGGYPSGGSYPAGGSSGSGSSGSWSPPSNGTAYQPPNVSGGSSKPTYTPVQSNNAVGRFTINAVGAFVALAVSAILL